MAFSSGTFSRLFDWTTDRDAGVKIRADRFDQELDGFATGLTTTILKDGTQTTTAVVPFAFGISIVDNKAITLGTNSDITIQYDETTNDSLEIAAAVEGAALGIVLKSDQGDDNADQHKLSIADGGTLTLASKISGSFVTYLTHTPNSTVASSTLAVAGNLTVGGSLTLGSGAVLSEAELEQLDGITAGTVTASKAVVVDSNKDIASFRNITLTGELDAGSLDVSGDADIDGTLEADAITVGGTALNTVIAGVTVTNATTAAVATTVTISDNESTNEENAVIFTAGGDVDGGNIGLESDGDLTYNPSTGTVTATVFKGNIDAVDGDFDGTLEADAMTLNGSAITTTATLSTGISNGNVLVATSGVADNDFLRVDGTSIEGRSASEVLSDIGASAVAGSSSIVTTGALNSGSITSGFGAIDNGSSAITTTGAISGGTVTSSGDLLVGGVDFFVDTSADKIGIGTSTANQLHQKLTIYSSAEAGIQFQNDATGVTNNTDGCRISVFEDDIQYTNYEASGKHIFNGGSSTASRLEIEADGDVNVKTGNLVIGTSGKGIDFSATSDASGMSSELLDEYEEGTFNVTATIASGALTISGSYNKLSYTKIGQRVFISGGIRLADASASGSPSGAVQLDDLPFTPASADEDSIHSVFYIGTDGMTGLGSGGQPMMGQVIGGNNNIFIFTQDQNGFADPGNHFTDNSILRFNFSYVAA